MRISILQRGGLGGRMMEVHRQLIEEAARYFAERLLTPKQAASITLRICLRATTMKKGNEGQFTIPVNAPKWCNLKITLGRDLSIGTQITSLAHEMVHLAQFVTGRLQAPSKSLIYWDGTDMTNTPYDDQPWEIEAYVKQYDLTQDWIALTKENRTAAA